MCSGDVESIRPYSVNKLQITREQWDDQTKRSVQTVYACADFTELFCFGAIGDHYFDEVFDS